MSRLNFIRQMPRTRKFLTEDLGAVEMNGYNKVADNTYVNLVPMFAGKYVEELPWDESTSDVPFDAFPFLWKNFSDIGYRTLYAEDAPKIAIFNYNKAGFHSPPADHYLRPFSLAVEDHGSMWDPDHDCVGSKLETEVVLDYMFDFEQAFRSEPRFTFGFITRLTHENVVKATAADRPYFEFFRRLHSARLLENTVVIFYSDHGMRFGDIRQTYIGKMEERLPFMYVALPPNLRTAFPDMFAALQTNAYRLSTPFDIYETIRDLMVFDGIQRTNQISKRGSSLLSAIPSERSCELAGILPHWCTCHELATVDTDNPDVITAAMFVVRYINDQVGTHGGRCAELSLTRVMDARQIVPRDRVIRFRQHLGDVLRRIVKYDDENHFSEYQLVIQTDPGSGIFEATVRQEGRNDKQDRTNCRH